MKLRGSLGVALVVCGTLFMLTPSISDYLHGYQVAQFLRERTIQTGVTTINPPLGIEFRTAAWVLGSAMIGAAIFGGGMRPGKRGSAPADDVTKSIQRDAA